MIIVTWAVNSTQYSVVEPLAKNLSSCPAAKGSLNWLIYQLCGKRLLACCCLFGRDSYKHALQRISIHLTKDQTYSCKIYWPVYLQPRGRGGGEGRWSGGQNRGQFCYITVGGWTFLESTKSTIFALPPHICNSTKLHIGCIHMQAANACYVGDHNLYSIFRLKSIMLCINCKPVRDEF